MGIFKIINTFADFAWGRNIEYAAESNGCRTIHRGGPQEEDQNGC